MTTDRWSTRRRTAALESIVETAWELARENSLAGLSLRELARRLGMAPASLYSYIDSEHGPYDAMFAQGYRALLAREAPAHSDDLRIVLHSGAVSTSSSRWRIPCGSSCCRSGPHLALSRQSRATRSPERRMTTPTPPLPPRLRSPRRISTSLAPSSVDSSASRYPTIQVVPRWVRLLDDAVDLIVPRLKQRRKQPAPAGDRQTGKKDPA